MKFKILTVALACLLAVSCNKQKEEKSYETILQTINYGDKQYKVSFKLFRDNKIEAIPSKDNEEFKKLMLDNPECVLHFDDEMSARFFPNRNLFLQAFPPQLEATDASRASNADCAKGGGNARVRFYKHNSYNTQQDVQFAGDGLSNYQAYFTNYGGTLIGSDHAYTTGVEYGVRGFRVSYVGNANNDQLSSLKMESYTKVNGSSSVANADPLLYGQGFTVVLFNHSEFRGAAISFQMRRCTPFNNIDRLSRFRFAWIFANWNDRVSSYYGYYNTY